MLLKDGTTSKNMLPRGLTSLLWGRNVPSEILYILEILSNPAIPYPAIRLEIESDPIHPMLTAAASSHALKTAPQRSPSGRFRNSKTPWPWRTNESENPTQKLSNVTSETLETEQKTCKKLAAAAATAQRHSHTALPDGETPWPWSPRIPPKNSLTSRLKPRNKTENLHKIGCCCCYCHCTKTQPHGPAGRGSTMARNDLQKHAAPRLDVPSMRPERPFWNPILEILSNPAIPYPAIRLEIESDPIHPMLTAAASSHALKTAPQRSPSGRFRNSKTPWPWRTNESENPTQKLSNVTSETLETEQKTCKKLAAVAATAQRHSHTALPDGETPWPWSPRIPPKNSLTSHLKPRNKTENLHRNKTENLHKIGCCCYCHCTKTQPHGPAGRGSTMALKDERVRESHPKIL